MLRPAQRNDKETDMAQIYTTTVRGIGPEAASFAEQGMYVLFGDGAPASLADFCFTIDINRSADNIRPGDRLVIDGTAYPITAVGGLVRKNLDGLGHITLNFDGAARAQLEGTLHVQGEAPALTIGSTISIEN